MAGQCMRLCTPGHPALSSASRDLAPAGQDLLPSKVEGSRRLQNRCCRCHDTTILDRAQVDSCQRMRSGFLHRLEHDLRQVPSSSSTTTTWHRRCLQRNRGETSVVLLHQGMVRCGMLHCDALHNHRHRWRNRDRVLRVVAGFVGWRRAAVIVVTGRVCLWISCLMSMEDSVSARPRLVPQARLLLLPLPRRRLPSQVTRQGNASLVADSFFINEQYFGFL
ncbi:uncharacterized protein MYCFIDRAFT_212010, partial [Pseudocercospora fijiensis CIRAD86]